MHLVVVASWIYVFLWILFDGLLQVIGLLAWCRDLSLVRLAWCGNMEVKNGLVAYVLSHVVWLVSIENRLSVR